MRERMTYFELGTGVQTCALPVEGVSRNPSACRPSNLRQACSSVTIFATEPDGWLEKGANLILFGPPGGGKSHLAAAIGLQLVQNGWRVLFTRTSELVQKLQLARRELEIGRASCRERVCQYV